MAVDYLRLFTDIGKYVKATDLFRNAANSVSPSVPDYDALLAEIQTRFETSDLRKYISGLESDFNSYRNSNSSWARAMSDRAQRRLLDRDTVVNQLAGADVGDVDRTIRELYSDMENETESINSSLVTFGSEPVGGVARVGDGTIITTNELDAISSPGPGFGSSILYHGKDSQLAVPSEEMTITCIEDEPTNGRPEGHELFLWEGKPVNNSTFGWKTEGSGTSQSLSTLQAAETLSNRSFEAWNTSLGIPTSWVVESGVGGTDVVQETTAADVHRGNNALKLVGNTTDILLYQNLPAAAGSWLIPGQRLQFVVYVKALGVTDGKLTIKMESPSGGYTADPADDVELDTTALTTIGNTYALQTFSLLLPFTLPDDLRWVIRYESDDPPPPGPTGEVWLDSMGLAPMTYSNGVGLGIVAGATSFLRPDRFVQPVTNAEGVFSRFFRRRFLFQLPHSGSPTRADSLAT